jgi:hypothetical protein
MDQLHCSHLLLLARSAQRLAAAPAARQKLSPCLLLVTLPEDKEDID